MQATKYVRGFMAALAASLLALPAGAVTDELRFKSITDEGGAQGASTTFKGDSYESANYEGQKFVIPETATVDGTLLPVTSIGDHTFYGCTSLTDVVIMPETLTTIGDGAFQGCTSLKQTFIPESVTSIGDNAFSGCSKLTQIVIYASKPPKITSTTFDKGTTIYVPATILSRVRREYQKAEHWKNLTIKEMTHVTDISLDKSRINTDVGRTHKLKATIKPEYATNKLVKWYSSDPGVAVVDVDGNVTIVGRGKYGICDITARACESKGLDGTYIEDYCTFKVPLPQCPPPTISIVDGKLVFDCGIEGADYEYSIKAVDDCKEAAFTEPALPVTGLHEVTCVADAPGYDDSNPVTANLWLGIPDDDSDDPALEHIRRVLISSYNGLVTISGLTIDEKVSFYAEDGTTLLESITVADELVTYKSKKGNTLVIKFSDNSFTFTVN